MNNRSETFAWVCMAICLFAALALIAYDIGEGLR